MIGRLLTIFFLFRSATRPTRHLLAWLIASAGSGVGSTWCAACSGQFLVEADGRVAQQLLLCPWQRPRHGCIHSPGPWALRALRHSESRGAAAGAYPAQRGRHDHCLAASISTTVGILYDHAPRWQVHFNGHAFVSLTMMPVLHENAGKQQIRYIAVPIATS